jgi:hypothetical protein
MMMMMMMMTICKDLPFTLHNKQKHERVYLNLHTSIIFSLSLSLFKHQIQRSREINVFSLLSSYLDDDYPACFPLLIYLKHVVSEEKKKKKTMFATI